MRGVGQPQTRSSFQADFIMELFLSSGWEGDKEVECSYSIHIPYCIQWGAVWSYLEFPNHLIVFVLISVSCQTQSHLRPVKRATGGCALDTAVAGLGPQPSATADAVTGQN